MAQNCPSNEYSAKQTGSRAGITLLGAGLQSPFSRPNPFGQQSTLFVARPLERTKSSGQSGGAVHHRFVVLLPPSIKVPLSLPSNWPVLHSCPSFVWEYIQCRMCRGVRRDTWQGHRLLFAAILPAAVASINILP
jgi:hypothetical protein